jgi:hypothetical protein
MCQCVNIEDTSKAKALTHELDLKRGHFNCQLMISFCTFVKGVLVTMQTIDAQKFINNYKLKYLVKLLKYFTYAGDMKCKIWLVKLTHDKPWKTLTFSAICRSFKNCYWFVCQ